jgi:hypothetical protein
MGLLKKQSLHVADDIGKKKVRGKLAAITPKFHPPKHQIILYERIQMNPPSFWYEPATILIWK